MLKTFVAAGLALAAAVTCAAAASPEFCGAWFLGPSGSAVRELAWLFVGGRGWPVCWS